jgi:hypothetical protein
MQHIIRTLVCSFLATGLTAISGLATDSTPPPIIYPARTNFQYTLPYDAMTTAGVYSTDNKLIRVLWRKQARRAGTYNGVWEGKDENSQPVPAGVYTIKLIAYNVEYVWDGLVGNTSTSLSGPSHHAAQGFIQSMAVDGTNAFYALGEQEGFPPVRRLNTGSPQTATSVIGPDARVNFDHVATDGVRVYYANKGSVFSFGHPAFVAASNVSDNLPASFTAGVPISANPGEPVYPSCIDVWAGPHPNGNNPTGLAVQKNGSVLAVSHGGQNLIRLFHKTSGDPLGTISVANPQELAMTSTGDLWVMTGTTIRRYTNLTTTPTVAATITGLSAPAAITTDVDTLIVADAGTKQQLKAYNLNGAPLWTFPTVEGGYATRGPDVTNDKFQFQVGNRATPILRAALAVSAGSIWVGDGATDRLLRLNASNRSYIDQIMFLTHNLGAVADPKTPTRLIGDGWLEFQIDYTRPLQNGGWSLRKNWAAGVPNNFFGGLDEGIQEVTTLSNGRVYGTITDYSSSPKKKTVVELPATGNQNLRICKDASNNNLVLANEPTASAYGYGLEVSQPPSFESDGSQRFHRIANGRVTWYQRDLALFDTAGNPTWAPERILASAPYVNEDPVVFNELALRQGRHPITSSNILLTFDDTFQTSGPVKKVTFPSPGSSIDPTSWKHLGGIGVGQVDWGWKQSGSAVTCTDGLQSSVCSYSKAFGVIGRYDLGDFDIGDGVQYAGSLVMAQGRNVVYGYPGEFWRQTEASQWMHFYDNGLFIGQFGTPGTFRNRFGEALPGFTGNCFYPTMVGVNGNTQATTGDTYLWADDKSLHSGVARWHLVGTNTVQEFSGSGQGTVILTALPAAFPTGLSAVPGHQQVSLTWQPATPATGYDIKVSTTNGGPYTTVVSTTATSHTVTGLANGVKYYFVVAATGSAINSNQAAAFPFNQVGIAGRFKGGPSDPWYLGMPMVNLPAVLGDLTRTEVGSLGSVLYNWWDGGAGAIGSSPVPFSTESRLAGGISVNVVPGPWINDPQYVKNQFFGWKTLPNGVIDWIQGHDAAIDLPSNSTGSVNINVSDNAIHYVTVVSPAYFDRRRDFTISIAPQGQGSSPASSYTVNDPDHLGDNHVFQFVFRGNITLWITNRADTGACLQGLFFD